MKVAIRDDEGHPQYLLTVLEDVTDRKRDEQRIARMAHHDSLTDLPNRAAFNNHLSATLAKASAEDKQFAILSVDFDRFKEVNDVFGHAVGDTLLCQVAKRLQTAAGEAFIARLGGDEFSFIVEGEQPSAASDLANKLLAATADDFEVDGLKLRIGLSIGAAIYPTDSTDVGRLMNKADAALYRAKSEARGTLRFFEAEMDTRLRDRLALQNDLRTAIDHNELRLHYQPQLRMSGETVGFEALVRWQCPKRGLVLPGIFIPVAEDSSLIISLGEWVLREACREAATWPGALRVAVNVSPIQFRYGDLPRLVHSILLETGLNPDRLELEITETVMISDFARAVAILRRLKALGVRIAMDDFGTGYSSLSFLQSFPCDRIKIDRTFVRDLEHNQHSRAIVRAVIGLGRSLGTPTLAEGVETAGQHAWLAQAGCDEVQGYLTGRPLPIEDYAGATGRQAPGSQQMAS
jgi:diguanylate cyclase (GGDEF)-like protein